MSDSLIDEALGFCREALLEIEDTPARRQLRARFGVLERAAWSLAHQSPTQSQVVSIARLILALRDDVVLLQAAPRQGPTTAFAIASAVSSSETPSMCLFQASTIA